MCTLSVKSALKCSLNPEAIHEWDDSITMETITKREPKCLQIFPSIRQPLSLIKYKVTFQIHIIKYSQMTKKKSNIRTGVESTILKMKKKKTLITWL